MRPRLAIPLAPLLACLVLLVAALGAKAATICVADPACPAGAETQPSITGALLAAADAGTHPGPDRILLGPGTYTEAGLRDDVGSQVELVGAGAGQTTIAAPGVRDAVALDLEDPGSTVSDLTVQLPEGGTTVGLRMVDATARRVAVTGSATATGVGVQPIGSAAFGGSIALAAPTATIGAGNPPGVLGGTLQDATVQAATGTEDVAVLRRVRIDATSVGIHHPGGFFGGVLTLDDALVRLTGGGAVTGIANDAFAALGDVDQRVIARHLTLIGNGDPSSVAVEVTAHSVPVSPPFGGHAAAATALSSTILDGFGTNLKTTELVGGGATIAVDYSNLDTTRVDTRGGGTIAAGPHDLALGPGLRDAAAGDYALRADSPLIDRGDPAAPAAGEPTTDLAGAPRAVDGDGDGSSISDMGAFEYQPPTPPAPPPPAPPPAPKAPVLGALALTHAGFAAGSGATATTAATDHRHRRQARHARPPHGTSVFFTLDRPARVAFTVERAQPGLRAKGACIAPTRRLRRARARRCTRHVDALSFARNGRGGANGVAFSGRTARGRALPTGSYRLLAVAHADGLASATRAIRFAIVRG